MFLSNFYQFYLGPLNAYKHYYYLWKLQLYDYSFVFSLNFLSVKSRYSFNSLNLIIAKITKLIIIIMNIGSNIFIFSLFLLSLSDFSWLFLFLILYSVNPNTSSCFVFNATFLLSHNNNELKKRMQENIENKKADYIILRPGMINVEGNNVIPIKEVLLNE